MLILEEKGIQSKQTEPNEWTLMNAQLLDKLYYATLIAQAAKEHCAYGVKSDCKKLFAADTDKYCFSCYAKLCMTKIKETI